MTLPPSYLKCEAACLKCEAACLVFPSGLVLLALHLPVRAFQCCSDRAAALWKTLALSLSSAPKLKGRG